MIKIPILSTFVLKAFSIKLKEQQPNLYKNFTKRERIILVLPVN